MELSVVISVQNGLAQLQQCIKVLREYRLLSCEYIVVDNGTTDETAAWIEKQKGISLVCGNGEWGIARSFNVGRKKAQGKRLLFLHDDAICSRDALPAMMKVLELDGVAAAGPFTNGCMHGRQFIKPEPYKSVNEMQAFAEKVSRGRKSLLVDVTFCLESFCLMVNAAAFDAVGGFDEQFDGVGYEDVDLSFKLIQAGYWLCTVSVYVHHGNRAEIAASYGEGKRIFRRKWGFDLLYSGSIRYNLLHYIDVSRPNLSVLDFGCALGGNLMYLKWLNRNASLFGIELNPRAAEIAKNFGDVIVADVETIDYEALKGQFDYVIAGDLIEHLRDPWGFVKKVSGVLKPEGEFLASIPNVAHISNVYNLLRGVWEYTDAGLLDRTHLRFFTRTMIIRMFEEAGFQVDSCRYNLGRVSKSMRKLFNILTTFPDFPVAKENLEAYQIFVKARKVP